jgi:hypothetical protein
MTFKPPGTSCCDLVSGSTHPEHRTNARVARAPVCRTRGHDPRVGSAALLPFALIASLLIVSCCSRPTRPLRLLVHNVPDSVYFNLFLKLRDYLCSRFEGVQKADEGRHRRS